MPREARIPFRAAAQTRKVLKKNSVVRGVQKHHHLFVTLLSSVLQRSALPLVLQSGVRSTLQEEVSNGGVPVEGGPVKRSLLLHVRFVDVRARLQQHLNHLHGPPLRSEEQRRGSLVPRLVRVRAVLEEDLGDLWEPLPCGLDQWRGSHIGGRPVDLDATPVGCPLQQPPRGVRLPVVRGEPQRGLFVPPPPDPAGARRHEAVHLEPRVPSFGRVAKTSTPPWRPKHASTSKVTSSCRFLNGSRLPFKSTHPLR